MVKQVSVIFTTNNTRVMVNQDPLPEGAILNPDLSKVYGEPPHFWKLVNGEILPMSRPEKIYRLAHIETHGCDNAGAIHDSHARKHKLPILILCGFVIGFLLGILL